MLLWLHCSHKLLSVIDTGIFLLTLNCVSKWWPPWFVSGAGHLSGWPAFTSGLWEAADFSISCSGQCRSWSIFHTRTSPKSDNWTENSSVYTGNVQWCVSLLLVFSENVQEPEPHIIESISFHSCLVCCGALYNCVRWGKHTKAHFHQTTDFQLSLLREGQLAISVSLWLLLCKWALGFLSEMELEKWIEPGAKMYLSTWTLEISHLLKLLKIFGFCTPQRFFF